MFSALYCCPFLVNEAYVGCSNFSYLLVGADNFQRDHERLLDTYREIRLLEEAVDEGVHAAPARLTQAKTHTGFSFGKCNLLKLSYLDIRNFVRLPQPFNGYWESLRKTCGAASTNSWAH